MSKEKKKNKKLKIKVRYFPETPEEYKLKKIDIGDWIDLHAYESVFCKLGERARIRLGVAIKLPKGYEAYIEPRSSLLKNYGLIAPTSIIDNSYSGNDDEWGLECICVQSKGDFLNNKNEIEHGVFIARGTRVCQFRIMKSISKKIDIEEVEHLDDKNRGGLGSTGTV